MSGEKWQRRIRSLFFKLGGRIKALSLVADYSVFGGLVVVLTGRWSLVQTSLSRNTEVQQKAWRNGFFPAGTSSQSSAELLLKLQGFPHDALCSFFPSFIHSSLTRCLFPTSASGPQGKPLCQHSPAADTPLEAALSIRGSSSSCSSEGSINTSNFFSHPGSARDNSISLSFPSSHCVMDSRNWKGNPCLWVRPYRCKAPF